MLSDQEGEAIDYGALAALWIAVAVFVFFLVRRYSRKGNHPLVFLFAWIGWLFPFMIVTLLPLDLTASMYRKCKTHQKSCLAPLLMVDEAFLWVAWRTIYWTSFCLTMFILPLLQSYCDSGYFNRIEKFKKAIRANVIYYLILGVIGVIGIIVLFATFHPEQDTTTRQQAIVGLLMAMSNLYGLSLTVILLAFGLVQVPKSLWQLADRRKSLRQLELQAPKVKDAQNDANAAYDDLVKETISVSKLVDEDESLIDLRGYVDIVLEKCPQNSGATSPSHEPKAVVDMQMITQLHKNIIRALSDKQRRDWEWNNLCQNAFFLQDVISNETNPEMRFKSITMNEPKGQFKELVKFLRWIWFIKLFGPCMRLAAGLCAIMSVAIIWSEATSAFRGPNDMLFSIVGLIFNAPDLPYTVVELLSLSIMFYICCCAVLTLFRVKVFNVYSLHADRQTGDVSMSWFTSYVCKLTFPLAYNFMTMTMVKGSTAGPDKVDPVFSRLMGSMNLAPVIGDRFQVYVPILVVVICVMNAFSVVERLSRKLGFDDDIMDMDQGDMETGFIDDGKILLTEARNGIERNQGSLGTIVNRASDYNNRVAEPHSAPPKKREFRQDFIAKNPLYEKYQRKLGDGDKQPLLKGDSSGGSSKGQNK